MSTSLNVDDISSASMPKVTVVTTVWNLYREGRVETFRQMMESVHNQTYPHVEHVVIDNNSNDGTADLIQEYIRKGWIAKTDFEERQGLWHGMNKGIDVATGEFINFMNSDDYFCRNDAIELSIKALLESGAEWSYADSDVIDKQDSATVLWRWHRPDWRCIFTGHMPNHQTEFIRTSLLRSLGKFDTAMKASGSDNIIMLKMILNKQIPIYVPYIIVKFRDGGASSNLENANREQQSRLLYDLFGEKWGMTIDDFATLYGTPESVFAKKDIQSIMKLINKIQLSEWREYYNESYRKLCSTRISRFDIKLFSLIPIFKIKRYALFDIVYIFCLPTIKIKKNNNKKIFLLFGLLPVLATHSCGPYPDR